MRDELFGPIVTSRLPQNKWDETLELVDDNPYALTGAVFSEDRAAIDQAESGCATRPGTST